MVLSYHLLPARETLVLIAKSITYFEINENYRNYSKLILFFCLYPVLVKTIKVKHKGVFTTLSNIYDETIFAKSFILGFSQGSKYISEDLSYCYYYLSKGK